VREQNKRRQLKFDSKIKVNPQKYCISLEKPKNFTYIKLRRSKMRILLMLPYETGKGIIKKRKISMLSPGI